MLLNGMDTDLPNDRRYIYPVLDVDFVYGSVASTNSPFCEEAKPVLVTVFPFNTKGSLKDLIYRVKLSYVLILPLTDGVFLTPRSSLRNYRLSYAPKQTIHLFIMLHAYTV